MALRDYESFCPSRLERCTNTQKQQQFIIEVADYLVCKMEEIVSEAVYSIEQTLQQQQLNCFSTGVQGVVQQVERGRGGRRVG